MSRSEFDLIRSGRASAFTSRFRGGRGRGTISRAEPETSPLADAIVEVPPRQVATVAKKLRALGAWKRHELIPAGATWKYHDGGEDLGTDWRRHKFDDAGWKSGKAELGYGDADEGRPESTVLSFGDDASNKHPCYYFRREISIEKGAGWKFVLAEVIADDGCVVYLNGKEIFRRGMPGGGHRVLDVRDRCVRGARLRSHVPDRVRSGVRVSRRAERHRGGGAPGIRAQFGREL